jgi:diguanylate cyclase (GGDEF)-like protein
MIAVVSHSTEALRAEVCTTLDAAGWTVHGTEPAEALERCRAVAPDVLLADCDAALIDAVKRDPDLFRVAIVVMGESFAVPEVLDALDRGADDVLRTPLDPADLVGRAFAAARTKALVEELTAQNQRLEELVFFDELTGLRNRRAVLHELDMLVAGALRHGHPLTVLMLDVDRFKPINDRHGHAVGDEVLRAVAARLKSRLRRADIGGRIGGDELVVALPDTDAAGACVLADSIRRAVSAEPVPTRAGLIRVTVSIGTASWQPADDLQHLMERADQALYRAKDAGRDSVAA